MYKLLIVDDELPAVHAMQFIIDWEEHGIDEILTATGAKQARRVFAYDTIDVVICDIEMPGENGLSLLSWVRERYPATQFIFLTAHDKGEYLRTAIHNGCVDYLLKPVDTQELCAAVDHAIAHRKQDAKAMAYDAMQDQISCNLSGIYIEFWREYLFERIPAQRDVIIETAEQRGLAFADPMVTDRYRFFPILCCIRQWHDLFDDREKRRLMFAIRNVAEEAVIHTGAMGQFFQVADEILCGCLMVPDYVDVNSLMLTTVFEKLCDTCNRYFSCRVQVLACDDGSLLTMPARVAGLMQLQKAVVSDEKWLWQHGETVHDQPAEPIKPPDVAAWSLLLGSETKAALRRELETYLHQLKDRGEMTVERLYQFRQAFSRMLYDSMRSEHLPVYGTFDDRRIIDMEEHARGSIGVTVDWCMLMAERLRSIRDATSDTQPLIERIKRYIDNNLDSALSRSELSRVFFMHPDYLGRMFKKSTGVGLAVYIQDAKIKRACSLLEHTELPVGEVGIRTGYQSFPYFCKVFKEQMQLSPQQYRRRKRQNGSEAKENEVDI